MIIFYEQKDKHDEQIIMQWIKYYTSRTLRINKSTSQNNLIYKTNKWFIIANKLVTHRKCIYITKIEERIKEKNRQKNEESVDTAKTT